jgi:hypothetical protein
MKLLTRLAFVWAALLSTGAWAQYSTGFENPPFNSGTINGQDSWTNAAASEAAVRVRTAAEIADDLMTAGLTPGMTVHGGSQALLVTGNIASSTTVRSVPGLDTQAVVLLDVWARPLTAGSAGSPVGTATGNVFILMEDPDASSTSGRTAAFRFGVVAGSQTIDYAASDQAGVWRASGTLWEANTWYRLTMSADYTTKTYDFFINGTKANVSPISFYHVDSTHFDHVRVFRGNNQAGMILDDLSVIPEPTSVGCLLLGGTAVLLRRRRSQS